MLGVLISQRSEPFLHYVAGEVIVPLHTSISHSATGGGWFINLLDRVVVKRRDEIIPVQC